MNVYIAIFLWALVVVSVWPFVAQQINTTLGNHEEFSYSWLSVLIALIPLVYIVGMRGWVADTIVYRFNYLNVVPSELSGLSDYMSGHPKDSSFYFLTALIKIFITKNPDVYFLILALFQGLCVVYVFRKYSIRFELSYYLFIASTDYFSWMFNGIRQFTAVCICLLATPFLLKKKYIQVIVIIVIASLFHRSALLCLAIMLIVHGEVWNKRTVLFIIGVLIAIVFVNQFTSLLNDGLQYTQYKNVVSDYTNSGDNGTNPLRVLVYSVPAIISFVYRKRIRELNNPVANLCTNMSIASMGLYLISMVTSGVFIGRLPIYVSLYSYVLLPWECEYLFEKTTGRIIFWTMIGLYAVFYYYQMHVVWLRF